MEDLNNWIIATNDFIWTYILIALLICIGVYFTFKSKFVQFRNIREMFLLEAAFIGLLGGIAGNILSFVMSVAINIIVGSSGAMSMGTDSTISYIPWWLVLMSMVFAVLVGVLAGYFPAKRAMKLSPLAAIRNE